MSQNKKDKDLVAAALLQPVPVEVGLLEHNLKTDLAAAINAIINNVTDQQFIKNLSPARREELYEKVIQSLTDSFPEIMREIHQRAKETLIVFAEQDAIEREIRKRPGVN